MSDAEGREFGDLIGDTIADYLAKNGGGWVNSFHITVDYVSDEGHQSWMYATAADQPIATTMGLIEWSRGVATYEQREYLSDLGEDD